MTGRLSTTITACKVWVFRHRAARLLWYLVVVAALLVYWLLVPQGEISFVYNAF